MEDIRGAEFFFCGFNSFLDIFTPILREWCNLTTIFHGLIQPPLSDVDHLSSLLQSLSNAPLETQGHLY